MPYQKMTGSEVSATSNTVKIDENKYKDYKEIIFNFDIDVPNSGIFHTWLGNTSYTGIIDPNLMKNSTFFGKEEMDKYNRKVLLVASKTITEDCKKVPCSYGESGAYSYESGEGCRGYWFRYQKLGTYTTNWQDHGPFSSI